MILRFDLISSYAWRLKIFKFSGKLNLADHPASFRRIRDYMCFSEIRVPAMSAHEVFDSFKWTSN